MSKLNNSKNIYDYSGTKPKYKTTMKRKAKKGTEQEKVVKQ